MNILITGANGQLGQCFKAIIDREGNGHPDHDTSERNYYIFTNHDELDITDKIATKEYVHNHNINVIVNCAAYTAVDKAEDESKLAYKINSLGPDSLADAVKTNGGVLIHISTDYVFNGLKNGYYTEDDITNPLSIYGASKRCGEMSIEESGCNYLIFRTSWLYSEYGKNFVKGMYNRIGVNPQLKVVNDQFGNPTYAMDLAKFIYGIIENNNAENRYLSKKGIYHFSNDGTTSWYNLTKKIQGYMAEMGLDVSKTVIFPCATDEYPTKARRPANSAFDLNKTRETFDYVPRYWGDALKECVGKIIGNHE